MDDVKVVPADYKSSYKFDSDPLTEALWTLSMDSGQNETVGESDGPVCWNALFHFESNGDVEIQFGPYDNPTVEATVTIPRGSYILTEDSQGFVYTARYEFKSTEVKDNWQDLMDKAYPEHYCGDPNGEGMPHKSHDMYYGALLVRCPGIHTE